MSEFGCSRREDVPRLRQLWKEAFGDPEEFLELFFSTAYAPERSLVLRQRGQITGMCYWLDCFWEGRKLAYVYAVAIDPALQGQGWGSKLMRQLHTQLLHQGYDGVLLVPGSDALVQYYLRFGYRFAAHHEKWLAYAGAPVALAEITAGAYAAARRSLLPDNGVVQEGENLPFLAGSVRFYRGEDWIAAVSVREKYCLELLGERSRAKGITAALGLDKCVFRAPGGEHPYAMGKALGARPLPQSLYFGFGFDL